MPIPKITTDAETIPQEKPEVATEQAEQKELAFLEAKQGLEDRRNGVLRDGKYADMEDLLALAGISPNNIGMTEEEAKEFGLEINKTYAVKDLDPMKNDFIPSSDEWD